MSPRDAVYHGKNCNTMINVPLSGLRQHRFAAPLILAATGSLCIIATLRFQLLSLLIVAGVLLALCGAVRLLGILESDRNLKGISSALAKLDLIHEGLRVIGRDAEAIDWRRAAAPDGWPGTIEVVQLCRTRSGQWFEHHFGLRYGRAYDSSVRYLSESDARTWLSYDVQAYERVFGKAMVA